MSERLLSEHDESFPPVSVPAEIDRALKELFPGRCGGIDRAKMLALFDNRVTREAISHWRKGRRHMPQWARDRLIAAASVPRCSNAELLKKIPAPDYKPGAGLRRWRASKR